MADAVRDSSSGSDMADAFLQHFPAHVTTPAHPYYQTFQKGFWSASQRGRQPLCIFRPQSALELAQGLRICASKNCAFAVYSGGHGHYVGNSSIDDGVQFDLSGLNSIDIDRTGGSVRVGTGNRWSTVYETLQKNGIMAVGGRAAAVGVGGFLLGGGISFHAAERGWALDNVRSFEVALPSGSVITASASSHPELYRALRGGGSNFGVIASFELETHPYHGIWGGYTASTADHVSRAFDAYLEYAPKLGTSDNKYHAFITITNEAGPMEVFQYMAHLQPSEHAPIFDSMRAIPSYKTDLKLTDHVALATNIYELQEGGAVHQALSTVTFKADKELLELSYKLYHEEATKLHPCGARGTMEVHVVPSVPKNQPTVRGISEADGTMLILVFGFSFPDQKNDRHVFQAQQRIVGQVNARAEQRKLDHPFLFMNYAAKFQDVIGSYGKENVEFLRQVAKTYDPDQVIARLLRGPHKLPPKGKALPRSRI